MAHESAGAPKAKKADASPAAAEDESKPLIYDEFDALSLKQNNGKAMLEFPTLDEALDEFFAKVTSS